MRFGNEKQKSRRSNKEMEKKKVKNKSIYILKSISPRIARDGKKGHYQKDENDNVSCYVNTVGVFSSVKNAEDTIKKLVKADWESPYKSWYDEYFGFILTEHYIDNALCEENMRNFESIRSYINDGTLNCFSDLDFSCHKSFSGRKEPISKIKEGDIALAFSGSEIYPVLVDKLPMTEKEWNSKFEKGVGGDFTDDSGIVFTVDSGHEHPFSPDVFPISCLPFYNVTKKNLKKMENAKKGYYKGTSL